MKKLTFVLLFIGIFVVPVFVLANHTTEHTIAQLQAQIQELTQKIRALQAATGGGSSPSVPSTGTAVGIGAIGSVTPVTVPPSQTVPSIEPVLPIFDDDTSDDDIIQLNNLRIQSISSTRLPAIISASYDFGITCQKFETEGSGKGVEIPCPAAPSFLYQIRVDSDTILLLRNRGRARLSDFGIGDRINVYGFRDRDTGAIDALIVRNLDKPVVKQFIQLNNVEVVSGPSSPRPPAILVVSQRVVSPCLDFGAGQEIGTSLIIPCPLGTVRIQERSPVAIAETPPAYWPRTYNIEVTSRTQILDLNRRQLTLDKIQVGDTLNIYGFYTGDGSQITAQTIRDLSQSAVKRGTLQVTVSDSNTYCIQQGREEKINQLIYPSPPCGILYDAKVALYDERELVGTKTTERGTAVFEVLKFGNYTVVASAPGYESAKEAVQIGEGKSLVVSITMTLQKIFPPSANRPPQIIGLPSVPVSIEPGQVVSFSWSASDPDGDNLSWSGSVEKGGGIGGGWASPCPSISPNTTFTTSQSWPSPGVYRVSVTVNDCRGGSDTNEFKVQVGGVSSNQPPVISGVKGPTSLRVGETGTWSVSAYDPENGPLSYAVYWGDETPLVGGGAGGGAPTQLRAEVSQTATFSHSYTTAGVYTATFTITDNGNLGAKTSVSVNVGPTPPPPPIGTQSIDFTVKEKGGNGGVVSLLISDTNGRYMKPVWSREYAPYFSLPAGSYNATLNVVEYRSGGQQPNKTQMTAQLKTDGYNYSIDGSTIRINGVPDSEIAGWFFKAFVTGSGVQVSGAQGNESFNASFVLTDNNGNKVNTAYFTVPPYRVPVGQYTARITARTNTSTSEESVAFSVEASTSGYVVSEGTNTPPPPIASLTVISPNGGEVWQKGTLQTIQWSPGTPTIVGGGAISPPSPLSTVDIFLSSWNPPCKPDVTVPCPAMPTFGTFIVMGTSDDGAFQWRVAETLSGTFIPDGKYVIVISRSDGSAKDQSDQPFSVVSSTATVSEQVKCVFKGSTTQQKCYTAVEADYLGSATEYGCSGIETCVVDIKGTKGRAVTWKSSCGGYAYTTMDGVNEYAEFSCATTTPSVTVISPNGGEVWQIGNSYEIRWTSQNINWPYITIALLKGGSVTGQPLFTHLANDGVERWIVPSGLVLGSDYKISIYCTPISGVAGCEAKDQSDAPFSIVAVTVYPGFFMKTDKSLYSLSDVLLLTLSRADNRIDPYAVDVYGMKPDGTSKVVIFPNLQVSQNTTVKIQLSAWPLFARGGVGDYILATCPAGCVYGSDNNTNSVAFQLSASLGGTDNQMMMAGVFTSIQHQINAIAEKIKMLSR